MTVPEGYDADFGSGIGTGSLIGILGGVLGGPLGMLFGWGLGATIGSLVDADNSEEKASALREFSRRVPAGHNALALQTEEADTRDLDDFVSRYNGLIVRRPLDDVLAEAEAAQAAARRAHEAAEEQLRQQKKEERKEAREERIANLRAKFA